jgi:hypothetical protein
VWLKHQDPDGVSALQTHSFLNESWKPHCVAAGLALADFVMATAYQNPLVGVHRDTLLRIG